MALFSRGSLLWRLRPRCVRRLALGVKIIIRAVCPSLSHHIQCCKSEVGQVVKTEYRLAHWAALQAAALPPPPVLIFRSLLPCRPLMPRCVWEGGGGAAGSIRHRTHSTLMVLLFIIALILTPTDN